MPRIGSGTPTGGSGDPVIKKTKNNVVSSVLGRSLGSGREIFNGSNGDKEVMLDFKSIVAGAGISITSDANTLTISNTGGGGSVDMTPYESRLNTIEFDLANARSSLITVSSTVNNITSDITTLQSSNTTITTSVNGMASRVTSNEASLSSLTTTVANNTNQIADVAAGLVDVLEILPGKLNLTGGTLTGPLLLSGNPTQSLGAATKQYVDDAVTNGVATAGRLRIVEQTSSYTLTLLDQDRTLVRMNCASSANLTIPNDSSVSMVVGATILVSWTGVGQITIVGEGGVVVNTPDTTKIARRHGKAVLIKVAANTWDVEGNLEPL
jgi:hypothetical protein